MIFVSKSSVTTFPGFKKTVCREETDSSPEVALAEEERLEHTLLCCPYLILKICPSCESADKFYRRLPGCVVMGIYRTRGLFGRQKKDAWAASQYMYTLYGFRPRWYHFLSPLFLFLVYGRGNYISGTLIDTFSISTTRWNNPRNFPAVDFDWMIGA